MSNPTNPTDPGLNRTGIATSPFDSKELIAGAQAASPPPRFDLIELNAARLAFSSTVGPVGTMPPPASMKGAAKAAIKAVTGKHPMVFLDLLGERLAFERTGTRLYDALLVKLEAAHDHEGGPSREDLERIRDDELQHVALLREALETLGADPTAMTPEADITAVASQGLVAVLTDPRTTLNEALKTMLIAELADNDNWLLLADLASRLGHDELATQFRAALAAEEEHLARVRSWVTTAIDKMAGVEPPSQVVGGMASVTRPEP